MDSSAAAAALGALAQETRLDVFRFLVRQGPKGAAAGAIAERFGLPGATLSFHLNALRQAGLVTARREGRSVIYAPDFGRMDSLLGFLLVDCCAGCCQPRATVVDTRPGRGEVR